MKRIKRESKSIESEPEIDFLRQLGILSPEELKVPITVIGVGGIGSPIVQDLAKMGCSDITIYDADKVEPHNIPNQFFRKNDSGKLKVEATKEIVEEFTGLKIKVKNEFYTNQKLDGIVISGVDSMKVRKEIWQQVKLKPNIRLYIEARMGGEQFRIFAINPCDPDDIEFYEENFYSDEEVKRLPCTQQAILYTPRILSGLVGVIVKKHIKREKCPKEIIFDLKTLLMVIHWGED